MRRGNLLILLPAALLLIAVMPLPYGYYTFLRLVVTAAAAFVVWIEYSRAQGLTFWAVLFALLGLLFNPLIPVHLSREVWAWLDVAAAGTFAAYWWLDRKSSATN